MTHARKMRRLGGRALVRLAVTAVSNSKRFASTAADSLYHFHAGFDPALASKFSSSFVVRADFVSAEEERALMAEVEPHLKRQVYERDHWDEAIAVFRETERKNWNKKNAPVVERIKSAAFDPDKHRLLPYVHVLDLSADGHIKPHVDSARFCGDTVAVLSLLSDSVARFVLEADKTQVVDCMVPARSLYVMAGSSRYDFTHEILADGESEFGGVKVPRARRVSVICRCEPD